MCFSAEASFAASAVIGAVGISGVKHIKMYPESPNKYLALTPLVFSAQQFAEGINWLFLKDQTWLTLGGFEYYIRGFFLLFYLWLFDPGWPTIICYSIYYRSKKIGGKFQKLLGLLTILALGYTIFSTFNLISQPVKVTLACTNKGVCHGIRYSYLLADLPVIYLLTTIFPLLFLESKLRFLNFIPFIVNTIAYITIAILAPIHSFASTWCFFAAILSIIVIFLIKAEAKHFSKNGAL